MEVETRECGHVFRGVNCCLDAGSFASDLQQVVAAVGIYEWKWCTKGASTMEASGPYQFCGVNTSKKRGAVDPDELANLWRIGTDVAKRTLDTCTQLLVRSSKDPTWNKRFSTSDRRLNRILSNVCMDTFFTSQPERRGSKGGTRSLRGFGCTVISDLKELNCLMALWCYCLQRSRSEINHATAADNLAFEGTNPHTRMTGQTYDISNLCQFGWYDWVYFRDEKASFPYPKEVLGLCCLGPAIDALRH
jgi:hypothetical protein